MKITPALPNPYQRPAQRDRSVVGAVQESLPVRDAADGRDHRAPVVRRPEALEPDEVVRSGESYAIRQRYHPPRVSRALASYARVADEGEQNSLREMLGFDGYA